MSTAEKTHPQIIKAATLAAAAEYPFRHPLNPASEIHFRGVDGKSMSELAGLQRLSVYTARIPPGRDSFAAHFHYHGEEFLFVLSGRGLLQLGDQEHEIGPGDFAGFPAGGPAHLVRNPFAADLILMMGGDRPPIDLAEFPQAGKHLVRAGEKAWIVETAAMKPAFGDDEG